MTFAIELEREHDGRWLAEVSAMLGVMCYGQTVTKRSPKSKRSPCE